MSTTSRLRKELQTWRMTWQQVETFIDRLEGARQDDAPDAWTCAVVYEALDQVEALRCRRFGWRLVRHLAFGRPAAIPDKDDVVDEPGAWDPGTPIISSVELSAEAWSRHLPDALDMEIAVAVLEVDPEDGKPADPPKVILRNSSWVLEVWSDAAGDFVDLYAPHHDFGRFEPALPAVHPLLQGLVPMARITPELGPDADSDVGLYSLERRKVAAEESYADTQPWSVEHERRRAALHDDTDAWEDTRGTVPYSQDVADDLSAGDAAAVATAIATWRAQAQGGLAHLAAVRLRAEAEELDDEVVSAIEGLEERLGVEVTSLAAMEAILAEHDPDLGVVAIGLIALPTPGGGQVRPHVDALMRAMDQAVAARLTVPDGSQRQVRVLEEGLARFWRSRRLWFEHRRRYVLDRLLWRFLLPFSQSLSALIAGSGTVPSTWLPATVARAATTGSQEILLQPPPGSRLLRRQRAGRLMRLGGARPTAVVVLHGRKLPDGRLFLRTLPLRTSLAADLGLDGVPGLVAQGAPVVASARPVTGPALIRGRFEDEPEADGILHATVSLWGQLALLQGGSRTPALPAPFDPGLRLPVHVRAETPVVARAGTLILPTAFAAGFADAEGPKLGCPGERLLLTGQTASGTWQRGVVEVGQAEVTTLEILEVEPERDPASPVCCTSTTPVVLLRLASNSVVDDLVANVWITRDFFGFGPSLAVGTQLPTQVDTLTPIVRVTGSGAGLRFVTSGAGAVVDRGPELAAAKLLLDAWVREG